MTLSQFSKWVREAILCLFQGYRNRHKGKGLTGDSQLPELCISERNLVSGFWIWTSLYYTQKNGSYGFKPEWCILDQLQLVSRGTQGCPLSLSIICTLLFSSFPSHPLPISNMFLAPHHVILTKVLPPNETHGHAIVWWWSLLLFGFN